VVRQLEQHVVDGCRRTTGARRPVLHDLDGVDVGTSRTECGCERAQ
jgi:hypothetical protein